LFLRFTGKLDFPIVTRDWSDRGNGFKDGLGKKIREVKAPYFGVGVEFDLALGYRIK
jgi:hypothetical protein